MDRHSTALMDSRGAAAVLDKLQEKDLISNEKFDAVRNLNERLFKDELYEVQGIKSLRFLIYELE